MREGEWRPVLAIGRHGLALGLDDDGQWSLCETPAAIHPVSDKLVAMLPVLEQSYTEVMRLTNTPGTRSAPPWDEVLRLALEWPTDYWPDRALDWLEAGYSVHKLAGALKRISESSARSQQTRHRARRLLRRC
ncbi:MULTISPECIES: hypothetical protein [Amycolatopsis]|uniref:Uncharacterized protein n=1 Tax=Amycolatopsis dongchuanensis TaxID=1070866 RepID=A0ABP9PTJ6_9PSEU